MFSKKLILVYSVFEKADIGLQCFQKGRYWSKVYSKKPILVYSVFEKADIGLQCFQKGRYWSIVYSKKPILVYSVFKKADIGLQAQGYKLEYSLRLKIKHKDWLLAEVCPQAAKRYALF